MFALINDVFFMEGTSGVYRWNPQDNSHDMHPPERRTWRTCRLPAYAKFVLAHGIASWREERLLLAPSSKHAVVVNSATVETGNPVRAKSTGLVQRRESTNYLVPSDTGNYCGLQLWLDRFC